MKSIAWAIVLAALIIFEALTWNARDNALSFTAMCFEIGCIVGIIKS